MNVRITTHRPGLVTVIVKTISPSPGTPQGAAVYCPDVSRDARARIFKAGSRKWQLVAQRWRNNDWHPQGEIGEERSLATAYVMAGAWWQSIHEMAPSQEAPRR